MSNRYRLTVGSILIVVLALDGFMIWVFTSGTFEQLNAVNQFSAIFALTTLLLVTWELCIDILWEVGFKSDRGV